jgi:hypothetical protein
MPSAGRAGRRVRLQGTGFGQRWKVGVFFDSAFQDSVQARSGAFVTKISVPKLHVGRHTVSLRFPPDRARIRMRFRILKSPPPGPTSGSSTSPKPADPLPTKGSSHTSPVVVGLPFALGFDVDAAGLGDRNGVGTGFTYTPPTNGAGYIPNNLVIDPSAGTLAITTTSGIAFRSNNSLDNGLSVGFKANGRPLVMSTSIISPPAGTGHYEQGGLWLGRDQDNYVKHVVISKPGGLRIEFLLELGGVRNSWWVSAPLSLSNSTVRLTLRANPVSGAVTAFYTIGSSPRVTLGVLNVPPSFFVSDPAQTDPAIGTKTFAGIFATNRLGSKPVTFTFGDFSLAETS